ncbi:HD domain-containing protein [Lysinibacillus odysseyi]|uniref:HAD family hydrolase n=1 Tax=Lysinibacillus odysseyi 34hs-1 = NBRC 100172 TaxID=1220589 RepID=A0A0A3JGL0_9BACI|nr:HD domain-containing protein [Lysinibacillus odysseyi]KGR86162.1 HAD family hydrolase [Lysinibacillus odysseyi 34hs-1 = NBRC 100172]
MEKILELMKLGQRLKEELRHSWLPTGRRESVAEHTWSVALMAIALEPYLSKEVKMERLLKMVVIHDLVEAYAKDVPLFYTIDDQEARAVKYENESKAIKQIRDLLGGNGGQELYDIWMEFEQKETYEARIVYALDKLEAQIQQNEADIRTWLPIEHEMVFMLGQYTAFDPALDELRKQVEAEGEKKLEAANINTNILKNPKEQRE